MHPEATSGPGDAHGDPLGGPADPPLDELLGPDDGDLDDLLELDDEPRTISVGKDRVVVAGDCATIESYRDMPDWVVHSHRPVRVHFGDVSYELTGKHSVGQHWHYRLKAWPADASDASLDIFYGEEYVVDRERRLLGESIWSSASPFVAWPLLALVGFFPRALQERLPERLQPDPHDATRASLFLQGALCFGVMTALLVTLFVYALSGYVLASPRALSWAIPVLGVDCIWRTHLILNDRPVGFYEWLWRLLRRGPKEPPGEHPESYRS